MLNLQYLSHSSFLLNDGAHTVVIDPFLTGNPTAPKKASEIAPDFIVLTHGHGDHLGDAIELSKKHNATIIAVNELANYVAARGCPAHNMHIGGGWTFPFGRVKFTIAHHGSGAPDGTYLGSPAGVVITMGGKKIYHTGDTGLFLDMKLIGERDRIDCMLLPIGDNFTMGVDDAIIAVDFVRPGLAIPMHFNTFPVIKADPEAFRKGVESSGHHCRVLGYGETLTLS